MSGELGDHDRNVWQKVSDATGTVVTPSNLLDGACFVGAKHGLDNLDSWRGIGAAAASFLPDIVDGDIARATGTSSKLGEGLDAIGDKAKMAYAVFKIIQQNLAPRPLVGAIAVQNGCNVALTTADQIANKPNHVLHSSWPGKGSMALEQSGAALHIVASKMEQSHSAHAANVRKAANVLGWAGVGLGVISTIGYSKELVNSLRSK
jgi:phosphatidylglycerophosphate synthase